MRSLCSQEPEGGAEACAREAPEQLSLSSTERGQRAGHDLARAVHGALLIYSVPG